MSRMLPDMYVANVKPLSSAGSATPSISTLPEGKHVLYGGNVQLVVD